MPSSPDFVNHVSELLGSAGRVTLTRMFGGHGVYLDGVFMAIIANDELYLKTDDATRAAFEDEGCTPFWFEKDGKRMVTHYLRAPGEAMDAPHLMRPWARLALDAALRARAAAPRKSAVKRKAAVKRKPAAKSKTAARKKSVRPAAKRT